MKKNAILQAITLSLMTGFSVGAWAMENDKVNQNITHVMDTNNSHITPDVLEKIFYDLLCFVKKDDNYIEQFIKSVKNQISIISLVDKNYNKIILNPKYFPLSIITKSYEKINPGRYFIISQPRILDKGEMNFLFQHNYLNHVKYIDLKIPTEGINDAQLKILSSHLHLTGKLTVNCEFQGDLQKSDIKLPSSIKVITYEEQARKNIIVPTYSSYSSSSLFNQLNKEAPELRDHLLNLLGQINKFKISESTIKDLIAINRSGKDYLIDRINNLGESEITTTEILAMCEIHLSEINNVIEQLIRLKSIPLSLGNKVDCLKVVHHTERDDFVKHISSIKGPVENYRCIMSELKDVPSCEWGTFIEDLNRISQSNMYYFTTSYDYRRVEKIDGQLVKSLKNFSSSPIGRTNFVTLLLEYLQGEKLDSLTLDKFADIHNTQIAPFFKQLQDLNSITLSLGSKVDCLKVVHHSERDDFVKHISSIKGPVYDYGQIMYELKDVPLCEWGTFIEDLNRISQSKIYYFTASYNYDKVDKIDGQLVKSLKKLSSSASAVGRSNFVTLLLTFLQGEKLDSSILDKFADIHNTQIAPFFKQLQGLKSIPLSLGGKVDCLKVVHHSERDDFVKQISSINGPVENYSYIMYELKDVPSCEWGTFIEDLNRISQSKMYYFTTSYDCRKVEKIDGQLVKSLKKVSSSAIGRSNFITLLLTYLEGEKLDSSTLDRLANIPLSKLESALYQLVNMDLKKSLYARISSIDLNALETGMDLETNLIPY